MRPKCLLCLGGLCLLAGCFAPEERRPCEAVSRVDFAVLRVIDGDTFTVLYDGEETSVRLLAPVSATLPPPEPAPGRYNAPELRDPGGREAAEALRRLILGRRVRMHFAAATRRDHFGRLLATAAVLPDVGGSEDRRR